MGRKGCRTVECKRTLWHRTQWPSAEPPEHYTGTDRLGTLCSSYPMCPADPRQSTTSPPPSQQISQHVTGEVPEGDTDDLPDLIPGDMELSPPHIRGSGHTRDNGCTVKKKVGAVKVELDNLWVVPYNNFLSAAHSCNITVDIPSSVSAVKYLYKFVYKPAAHAPAAPAAVNEINNHVYRRYVSATEAVYQLNGFDLHAASPNIYRLAVHLPEEQNV
ncbi:hypothetical protein WJX72_009536 [[Myrmecia] bisecta]|uniref:Uncharacterized protein n=1 Tax=[Myrmecia] bisecta TaxID=41462 RepID=A0AAW1QSY9_9CHLO